MTGCSAASVRKWPGFVALGAAATPAVVKAVTGQTVCEVNGLSTDPGNAGGIPIDTGSTLVLPIWRGLK